MMKIKRRISTLEASRAILAYFVGRCRCPGCALFLLCLILPAVLPIQAQGSAPFRIEIFTTGDPPLQLVFSGDDIRTIFETLILREGELRELAGSGFDARIEYLGLPQAFNLILSADSRSATLEMPEIGFSQSFSAASPAALRREVERFIRREGSEQIAELRRTVNKRSAIGVTDGNPGATTAIMANDLFQVMGLPSGIGNIGDEDSGKRYQLALRASGNHFRSGTFSGNRVALRGEYRLQLAPRFEGIALAGLNHTRIGGANIRGGNLGLGMRMHLLTPADDRPWR